jgi:hypothetical protein
MQGNGTKKVSLQSVMLIVALAFILVKDVIMPNVNSGKLADEIKAQAVAIGKLEDLPNQVREIRALLINHMSQGDKEKR